MQQLQGIILNPMVILLNGYKNHELMFKQIQRSMRVYKHCFRRYSNGVTSWSHQRRNIIRNLSGENLFAMSIEWTPEPNQLCLIPVDSQEQASSQVCLTFQVDVHPSKFILYETIWSHTCYTIIMVN
jgi:hypothetical protein